MNNTHEEMIGIIKAHKEGKQIQCFILGKWEEVICVFNFCECKYRIKPKEKIVKKITVWVNAYPSHVSVSHNTKEIADVVCSERRIACVELTGSYEVEE